ncbi:MAG: SRPBCC family protein [Bacteroidota bacterium]
MKVYKLERFQFLPISMDEAWNFFSSPRNLKEITPDYMKFVITYISGKEKMYAGQLISYIVHVLPGIPVRWTTEITHVDEPTYFVDEQRFGPYALWHHQHHFKVVDGGVEMTDIVNYAIPLGILGRLANWLFVGKKVRAIFDYRFEVLEKKFNK